MQMLHRGKEAAIARNRAFNCDIEDNQELTSNDSQKRREKASMEVPRMRKGHAIRKNAAR